MVQIWCCPALLCYVDMTRSGGNFRGDNPTSTKTHISAMVSLWKDFFRALLVYQTESGQQLAFATDAFTNQISPSQILGISQHVCKVGFWCHQGNLQLRIPPLRYFGCDAAMKSPVEITAVTRGTTCFAHAHGIFRSGTAE